jgi:hypothetical protein
VGGKDFTLSRYRELLESIRGSGYSVLGVRQFLTCKDLSSQYVVVRHDVDRWERRSLEMAELERKFNLQATYYFRVTGSLPAPEIVRGVAALGHEVGYHYEVMAKARGDRDRAKHLFREEISRLREMAPVSTAAMHGAPLSGWHNLDFWNGIHFAKFDLTGEAYLSFRNLSRLCYITDTGRGWNSKCNLRDRFPPGGPVMPGPLSTEELIAVFRNRSFGEIYLLVHPNRWTSDPLSWTLQWAEDKVANCLKRSLRSTRSSLEDQP